MRGHTFVGSGTEELADLLHGAELLLDLLNALLSPVVHELPELHNAHVELGHLRARLVLAGHGCALELCWWCR